MGTVIGTPAYMSPEQAAGRLDLLGPASDIYSLGATLYALLTGTAPFDESDKGELLQQVQRGAWRPPRQVKASTPPALDAICRKAMSLRPEDRYPSARALANDVERWLADAPVSARREPLWEQMRRFCRGRPLFAAWLGFGTAIILMIITALVGYYLPGIPKLAIALIVMALGLIMLSIVTIASQLVGLLGAALGAIVGTVIAAFNRGGARERVAQCVVAGGKIGLLVGGIVGYLFLPAITYVTGVGPAPHVIPVWSIIALGVGLPVLGFIMGAIRNTSRHTLARRVFRGTLVGAILGASLVAVLMTSQIRSGPRPPEEVRLHRQSEKMKEPQGCRQTAELWEKSLLISDPARLYEAACLRAITAAVLRAADPTPSGAKQADAEAEQAMAWLKKAVAAGYKDAAHMQKDQDLDALRDREDFKKLVAELAADTAGAAKEK